MCKSTLPTHHIFISPTSSAPSRLLRPLHLARSSTTNPLYSGPFIDAIDARSFALCCPQTKPTPCTSRLRVCADVVEHPISPTLVMRPISPHQTVHSRTRTERLLTILAFPAAFQLGPVEMNTPLGHKMHCLILNSRTLGPFRSMAGSLVKFRSSWNGTLKNSIGEAL